MQTSLKTMLIGSSTRPRIATSVMATKRKAQLERVMNKPQQFAHFPLHFMTQMPAMLSGIVTTTRQKNMAPTTRLDSRISPRTPIRPLCLLSLTKNGICEWGEMPSVGNGREARRYGCES